MHPNHLGLQIGRALDSHAASRIGKSVSRKITMKQQILEGVKNELARLRSFIGLRVGETILLPHPLR
jgi:hypothetical protein